MKKRVIGILLAAGNSSRMGENKIRLPLGETNVGSTSLAQALSSRLDHLIVVVKKGDDAQWIQASAKIEKNWSVLECEEAFRGQSFSLIAGIRAAESMDAAAAVILLGDQPFIKVSIIDELIHLYKCRQLSFAAARFKGIARPPVLFSAELFPMLYNLRGDRGAGSVLNQSAFSGKGAMIDYEAAQPFFDIDTKEDYEKAVRRSWLWSQ